ncbi:unnamed protein product [Euphydryas editha]|uniref:Chitin-binding type-2 domain-containing protein n=1 Tax=Euphydryas editha TaxID=104508 RepID=A0AAU9TF77_EUPED|nr:unnamed protein product [Euphydryas editha]
MPIENDDNLIDEPVFHEFDRVESPELDQRDPSIILPIFIAVLSTVAGKIIFDEVDPNTLSCDPKGEEFLLLPHFKDCSKFYMCTHGREVEFNCPGGLLFDFPQQTCNWPRDTKCFLREEDIEGSGEEEFDFSLDKIHESPVNSISAHTVVNSVRPLPDDTPAKPSQFNTHLNCQRPDSAAKRTAYKGDCQRYWRCVDGLPQTMYCTDGLFFNEATQQCDFEANVKCLVEIEDELKTEFIVYK